MPRGPLADTVEWLTRYQQILDQDQQPDRRRDTGSPTLAGKLVTEEFLDPEPFQQVVDDR
jgi:hypothetical protein